MSVVLSSYSKTTKSNSSGKPDADGTQAQQAHDASSRNPMPSRHDCSETVKSKWADIQKATKNKHQLNTTFTEILLTDANEWSDAYWQTSLEEYHDIVSGSNNRWILRCKAGLEHGGSEVGARAIDEAIAAGMYQQTEISVGKGPDGKPMRVRMVNVREELEQNNNRITLNLHEHSTHKWRTRA